MTYPGLTDRFTRTRVAYRLRMARKMYFSYQAKEAAVSGVDGDPRMWTTYRSLKREAAAEREAQRELLRLLFT